MFEEQIQGRRGEKGKHNHLFKNAPLFYLRKRERAPNLANKRHIAML